MSGQHDDNIIICQSLCNKLKKQFEDVLEDTICSPDWNQESKNIIFEKQKEEIFNVLSQFEIQVINWKHTKNELESKQKMLQLKLHELVLDANARKHCIQKFKETFSSQYVQIEYLKQYNKKLESNLESIKKELNRSQTSEKWFKNRLYSCQINKSKLNIELIFSENLFKQQIETIKKLNAELKETKKSSSNKILDITGSKNKIYREVQVKNTKDKETQTIDHCLTYDGSRRVNLFSEINFQDDFSKHKSFEFQNNSKNQKRNLLLEARCLNLEKSLISNNSIFEGFIHIEKQLCQKLILSKELEKNKNLQITVLIKEIDVLKMKVFQQIQEKEHLDSLALRIYQQFIKLKSNQEQFKAVLRDKEQLISVLYREKIKLIEDNNRYRDIEYYDKKKIRELSEAVNILEVEKQETAKVHYEELYDYNNKFNIMYNQINELKKNNEELIDERKTWRSVTFEPRNEFHPVRNMQHVYEEEEQIKERVLLKDHVEFDAVTSSYNEIELVEPRSLRTVPIPVGIGTANKYSNSGHIIETLGNNKTNTIQYGIILRNRFNEMKEKYKKLSETSSQNLEILAAINSLNVHHLVAKIKNLKISTEVQQRENLEQQKKFENHVRVLLKQVKKYKRSYMITTEHQAHLKDLFRSLFSELNWTKSSLQEITLTPSPTSHNPTIGILDDEIVNFDSGFMSSSEMSESKYTSFTDLSISGCLNNEPVCTAIQEFDTMDEHQTLKIDMCDNGNRILTIVEANDIQKACSFDNVVMLKSYFIAQLKSIMIQKEQHLSVISNQLILSDKLLKESRNDIHFLQKKINILDSHLQRSIMTIDELKQEKLSLINCLKQREELLGKICVAFKQKIQKAVDEVNDKFFLQRLCNDLKFAIKMYASQNKILRDVLQNQSKKKILSIDENFVKYYNLRAVLSNHKEDYYYVKKSFVDIQSYIDSMKNQILILQQVHIQS